jgi:nucleoside-diphosphate-sugar epimerase
VSTSEKHIQPLVLVTGGTGFVGSYLLRLLLARGYTRIRAIYRPETNLPTDPNLRTTVDWFECDILDQVGLEDAMAGVDWVFHGAALVSFRAKEHREMMEVNVEGTANLVNVALALGAKRFLHLSSVAAIGRTKPGDHFTEGNTWVRSPYNTQYGLSKYLSEQEVWRGYAEGLDVVVVNPSVILGSYDWEVGSARFFKMIGEGFRFFPRGSTGLVDVRDVAELMLRLMESELSGERFIANAETWPYERLFGKIAHNLGKPAPKIRISPFLQGLSWRLAWVKSLFDRKPSLITRETANQSAHTFFYENQKSKDLLQFNYRSIEETIREISADYQSSAKSGTWPNLPFDK